MEIGRALTWKSSNRLAMRSWLKLAILAATVECATAAEALMALRRARPDLFFRPKVPHSPSVPDFYVFGADGMKRMADGPDVEPKQKLTVTSNARGFRRPTRARAVRKLKRKLGLKPALTIAINKPWAPPKAAAKPLEQHPSHV